MLNIVDDGWPDLIMNTSSIQDSGGEIKRGMVEWMVYFEHGILFLVYLHEHC